MSGSPRSRRKHRAHVRVCSEAFGVQRGRRAHRLELISAQSQAASRGLRAAVGQMFVQGIRACCRSRQVRRGRLGGLRGVWSLLQNRQNLVINLRVFRFRIILSRNPAHAPEAFSIHMVYVHAESVVCRLVLKSSRLIVCQLIENRKIRSFSLFHFFVDMNIF